MFNENNNKNTIWSNKDTFIKSFYFNIYDINKDEFRSIILNNFEFGITYALLIRIEYSNGKFGMAGKQIGFNFDNLNYNIKIDELYNKILERIQEFCEDYNCNYLDSVQILFVKVKVLPKLLLTNINKFTLPKHIDNVGEIRSKFSSKFLPLSPNSNYFGRLVVDPETNKYIDIINEQKKCLLKGIISRDYYDDMFIYNNKYIVLNKCLSENIYLRDIYDVNLGVFEASFIDSIINDNTFSRRYKKTIITISNGKIINLMISDNLSIIKRENYESKTRRDVLVSNPFIGTLDLEVFKDFNGFGKVYAAGFCVFNEEPIMYYLDKENIHNKDVLLECLDEMLSNKYDGYKFYVHNLSYDGVFIIHKLKSFNIKKGFEYYKINSLFRDNKILKLEISVKRVLSTKKQANIGARRRPRNVKITLIDSFNLLSNSLAKLCESFGVNTTKGNFPHKFVTGKTLNYVGVIPSTYYWSNISKSEYDNLYTSTWNLKEECLFYLRRDLLSLLEIMDLFNKYVTRMFDIQLTDCLTISRLSLNIFLKDYLSEYKIPIIKGNIYEDIKKGYYGGVTEVYKPYGKNLYYYDVNSLYPFVSLNPMCGNKYVYIESFNNVGLDLSNLFGFFFCEVETNYSYLGLLPLRKLEGLLMPNGKWRGWYFSEELKFAQDNGYKIKVIKGYNFNKEYNIFNKYVNYLYRIKSTTSNKVEKAVVKSLLNNLLGRFGLNINKPISEIVNKDKLDYLLCTREFNSYSKITENDFLISYYPKVSKDLCEDFEYDYIKVLQESKNISNENVEFKDVSLVITAAVTAYARIYMSKIKLDLLSRGGNIFYTDTDSIVTDIPLDEDIIGQGLGKFKLEYKVKEGYFISSKTYCLILEDNSTIIKTKGLLNESLNVQKFKDLYKGIDVKGTKISAVTIFDKGSVTIEENDSINLKSDAYLKRIKVYDENNEWINTKALYINDIDDHNNINHNKDHSDSWFSSEDPPNKLNKINKVTKFSSILKILSFKSIRNTFKFLKGFFRILFELFMIIVSFILVAFVSDTLSVDDIHINREIELKEKFEFSICKSYNNKSIILDYINDNSLRTFNTKWLRNTKLLYRSHLLQNIYEDVWQEIISHDILNKTQFKDMDSIIRFTKNYLLHKINNRETHISLLEFISLVDRIGNDSINNNKLYTMIHKESLHYNIISKKYINKYTDWVLNPLDNEEPGNMIIKNKLSLLDELNNINMNYTCLLNDYKRINSSINNKVY